MMVESYFKYLIVRLIPCAFVVWNTQTCAANDPLGADSMPGSCDPMDPPHVEPGGIYCENDELYQLASLAHYEGELFWYLTPDLGNPICEGNYCLPLNQVGTTTYYVVEILGDCISEVGEVSVTILPLPDVQISPPSPVYLNSDSIVTLHSNFEQGNVWNSISGVDSIVVDEAGEYILKVTTEYGCVNSDTAIVIMIDNPQFLSQNFFIPNAFTPNGDGINDVFYIVTTGLKDFRFRIFNRWGHIIFETSEFNHFWDGGDKYFVPDGVYNYHLEYTRGSAKNTKTGHISVLR